MTTPASVTIDGVVYRPDTASSEVKIVILQRGWVMVGRWSRDGDMCALDGAAVIRQWGTTLGLGELVGGPTSSTVLDPTGHVEFHILTVVAAIDAEESAWAALLA
jgi:hypothetical protein